MKDWIKDTIGLLLAIAAAVGSSVLLYQIVQVYHG